MFNFWIFFGSLYIYNKMGRLKKYQTLEEKNAVKKQRAHDYYWNNKEQEDEKARERYYRNIQNNKS
jgi:hypothetical protein